MATATAQSAYAAAGVDYTKLQPFKDAMVAAAKRTLDFPNARDVYVDTSVLHSHGGVWEYRGSKPAKFCQTTEGLGNKNWLAELMHQLLGPKSPTYYDNMAFDTAMMAVNDTLAQNALPVIYTDEVAGSDSDWFDDKKRASDLANGFVTACKASGMALVAGESPALKYLVNPKPPVKSAPSLSGTVTAILAPADRLITGDKLQPGDRILGFGSSGVHSNGFSLIFKLVLEKYGPDGFLRMLDNGKLLGEELLTRTRCYVGLVEALYDGGVDVHAYLPGTGDGVAKLAFDKRDYHYIVDFWPWAERVQLIFDFLRVEFGITWENMLKTFNCGIGYYAFVPEKEVESALYIAKMAGYPGYNLGSVAEGRRGTFFKPLGIPLAPPGE